MEATLRLKRPVSLHRYRPEEGAPLSLVSPAPSIAQVEFDRRDVPASSRTCHGRQAGHFRLRTGRLGLLALILTVAEVQTVGASIVPGCFGNRGLSCRGTKSSNPSPSSGESTNFQFLDGAAAGSSPGRAAAQQVREAG